jgi:hypothetical protein
MEKYSLLVQQACAEMNPSLIVNYVYGLRRFSTHFTQTFRKPG